MQTSDWISLVSAGINLAIAVCTALAAKAAWDSAKASRQAVNQANQSAEDGRKIAEEQTKALMTASKANALATQIDVYTLQMNRLNPFGRATKELDELERKQKHLAAWLEKQTDALGVGLKNPLPDSSQT